MKKLSRKIVASALLILTPLASAFANSQQNHASNSVITNFARTAAAFNVRDFGAKGDGKTVDTPAVNRAVDAAAAAGGGTVYFPAGVYVCFSIRLKNNITLNLDNGATIFAADPKIHNGAYDLPEPNAFDMYCRARKN